MILVFMLEGEWMKTLAAESGNDGDGTSKIKILAYIQPKILIKNLIIIP